MLSVMKVLKLSPLLAFVACVRLAHDNPFDPEAPEGIRAKALVIGQVQLEGATALEEVLVSATEVRSAGEARAFDTRPDGLGAFALELPSGEFAVTVRARGHTPLTFPGVTLEPGDNYQLGALRLFVGRGAVAGSVVIRSAARDDVPAAAVQISLVKTDDQSGVALLSATGPDGRFRSDGVPEGEYVLSAQLTGYAPTYLVDPIIVSGGQLFMAPTLTLYPDSAVIQVVVEGQVGARFTGGRAVAVNLLAFVDQLAEMRLSEDPAFADPGLGDVAYRSFSASDSFTLSDTDGEHTIYVQFRDARGKETTVFSTQIVLDRAPPEVTVLHIDGLATHLRGSVGTVFASGSDALSGIRGYRVAIDGVLDTEVEQSAESLSQEATLSLVQGFPGPEGPQTLTFVWIDRAGNVSLPFQASIIKDLTPPSVSSFTVSPTPLTTSEQVVLEVQADGATEMLLSNFNDFSGAVWESYKATRPWLLLPGDGDKPIYLKLRDDAQNEITPMPVSVTLDRTPPSNASISINNGFPNGNGGTTVNTEVLLTVEGSDTNGIAEVLIANEPSFIGAVPAMVTTLPYVRAQWPLEVSDGLKFVYARLRDRAGNWSNVASAYIDLDSTAPAGGSIAIQGGPYTRSEIITVTLSADTSATIMQFQGDIVCGDMPAPNPCVAHAFAPSRELRLSTALNPATECASLDGCKRTISVTFRDQANNQSAAATTSVIFDLTAPDIALGGITGTASVPALEALYTQAQAVSLDVVPVGAIGPTGVYEMQISNSAAVNGVGELLGAIWQPAVSGAFPWSLTQQNGLKTVYIQARDLAGNLSGVRPTSLPNAAYQINLDTVPPAAPSLTVAGGAAYITSHTGVTLDLGTLEPYEMKITGTTSADEGQWITFAAQKTVDVADGEGVRNVSVVYRDEAGNESTTVTQSVILDPFPPGKPTLTILAPSVVGTDKFTHQTSVTIRVNVGTDLDVAQMRFSQDGGVSFGPWVTYAEYSLQAMADTTDCGAAALGCKTFIVEVRDFAGNPSPASDADAITLDMQAPSATIAPDNGALITTNESIVIDFSEPMNPLRVFVGGSLSFFGYQLTWNPTFDVLTVTPPPGHSWNLSGRFFYLFGNDRANNVLPFIFVSYFVDPTPPTVDGVLPANGATLSKNQSIVITFNELMDRNSLVLSGDLFDAGAVPNWTGNDTILTLMPPAGGWPASLEGASRSINITQVTDFAGNALTSLPYSLNYSVDATPPSATFSPASGVIRSDQTITVTFDGPVDQGSLVLTGTLGPIGSTGFTTATELSVPSTGTFNEGSGKTLQVTISDPAGNSATLSATYAVIDGIVYVDDAGTGAGTSDAPLASIRAAITQAEALYAPGTAMVRVAEGTYTVDSEVDDHVILSEGISVYGGYQDGFGARDPALFPSIIQRTATTGGTAAIPARTVSCGGTVTPVTSATIFDGFGVIGGGGTYTAAIACLDADSSPTISNCQVSVGSGSVASYGLWSEGSPIVTDNTISGGSGPNSYGVYVAGGSPTLRDNTLSGGTGSALAAGLDCEGGSGATIESNLAISGGTNPLTTASYGMRFAGTCAPLAIQGNIGVSGGQGVAVYGLAFFASANATLRDNRIEAGAGGSSQSFGVWLDASGSRTHVLERNMIGAGGAAASIGLASIGDTIASRNNLIGSGGGSISRGISCNGSGLSSENDTIDGGAGSGTSYGVLIANNCDPTIDNAIIVTGGAGSNICIFENDANSDPAHLRNIDVFGCTTAVLAKHTGGSGSCVGDADRDCLALAAVNTRANTLEGTAGLTYLVSLDPMFVDGTGARLADKDYRLQAGTPTDVREGGRDLQASFTDDLAGATRSTTTTTSTLAGASGWSLGCYEAP